MTKTILGFVTGIAALALIFVAWVYPEVKSAAYVFGGLLLACLMALTYLNQKSLKEASKSRSVRYGANAAVTVGLVFAILGVLNYLNASRFIRKDFTKDQLHSLSDQTVKILKDLKTDVKITAFVKAQNRDQLKGIFANYLYHSSKIAIEYVDPDRDPVRATGAGIKRIPTVILSSGNPDHPKESRIEEPTEEKITNGLIKILKTASTKVCFITGHGEKSVDSTDPEGLSSLKDGLVSQSYEIKSLNLFQESKELATCSVVLIMGPNKAFFDEELKALRKWIDDGGRALIAVDPDLKKSGLASPEMASLLSEWYVTVNANLILDALNTQLGVSPAVPLASAYSPDHAITKDFQLACFFPLTASLDFKMGAPANLKSWWIAKSTDTSVVKSDFKEFATGKVKIEPGKDPKGPFIMMAALEGSRHAASAEAPAPAKPTRLIVTGTSSLAINQYARNGANSDLFLNAVSWLANDESLISIRAKEEGSEAANLTAVESRFIGLFVKFLIPLSAIIFGVAVWWRRRTL